MKTISYSKDDYRIKSFNLLSARGITLMALLSAVSAVVMFFKIPLWFAPSFYTLDFSEVPVLIGAFALGPIAGVLIEIVKIILNLLLNGSLTAGIGEVANFILGCSLVLPSVMIYRLGKSRKYAIIGMVIGTISLIIAGCILNAYVLLPTYAKVFGMPIDKLVAMGTAVNPRITSLTSFVILAVAPFNLLKGVVVSLVTALIYKGVSPFIRGYQER